MKGFVVKTGRMDDCEYAIVVRPSDGKEICTAERLVGGKHWRNIEFTDSEHMRSNPTRQAAMRALQETEI